MRINPVMNTKVNFQRNDNAQPKQPSSLKNAAKAILVVPFVMPVMITACDEDPVNIDIDRNHDIHVTDTIAGDTIHDHYEAKAVNFNDAALDIIG